VAAVSFTRVTKRFGDTTAVDHLDLSIRDGEFLVLLGPSGCGKSTALRMLAGLEELNEGSIDIGGKPVADVDAKDRDVAMVFQSYALYPHMSVAKNIEFPLRPRKVGKAERTQLVREAAAMLGLSELLDRKPGQLSGGQRQRVALARAIVRKPQVFLMDEPLSNLDAKMRTQTRSEIVDLHRRLGTTFVYVTHDQVEAMTMADRIAIMSEGRLQQVGTPQEVYAKPVNTFVARFIGSPPMNIVSGVLESSSGIVSFAGAAVAAPEWLRERYTARTAVPLEVGVRPEQLQIVEGVSASRMSGAPAWRDSIALDVARVEDLGHEALVHGTTVAGDAIVARVPAGGSRVRAIPIAGMRISVAADAGEVHFFDAVSTERLDG